MVGIWCVIALSQQVQNMYGMFIKYVTSRLGCLGLPVAIELYGNIHCV